MPETDLVNNWLFTAMGEVDQAILGPQMRRQDLVQGEVFLRSGNAVDVVCFPASAQLANVMAFDTGERLAVSTVGREGLSGLGAFMANQALGWDAIAHVPGAVWTVSADILRERVSRSPGLAVLLLKAAHDNQIEAHGQTICATFHQVLPRLARWLLTLQERTGSSSFNLTQGEFASLLGVQRTTIVEAFKGLRLTGGLARRTRGRVVIRDRDALAAQACACYGRTAGRRFGAYAPRLSRAADD